MPKSRNRRKGRTRRTTRVPPPRVMHAPELQANMPWMRRLFEVCAAEASGDAAGALRLIEDMREGPDGRTWWRPERIRRLTQLIELGDSAPTWAWARWVVAQAVESTPGDPRRAKDVAVETRGGRSTLWGVDDVDAMAKVMDHDWVYRQLVLHAYGGLAAFLAGPAGEALKARADGIHTWVGVPMGGYELVDETTDAITWHDLGSDCLVRTINLGGAAMMAIGECVLGRVVSSGGVSLFESAPLCVPPDLARRVAGAPGEWLEALSAACRGELEPLLAELVARMHHFDLLFDLPCGVRRQLIEPEDAGLRSDRVGTGGNGQEYDVALVLAALGGEIDVEGDDECDCGRCPDTGRPLAPLVAAALLEPGTVESLVPLLVPSDARELVRLSRVLASPADALCGSVVVRLEEAA